MVGVILFFTGSDFSIWFPLIAVGVVMTIGWPGITAKALESVDKQNKK